MKLIDTQNRFNLFHKLIEKGCTGSPSELAAMLGVSRATLYRFIGALRDEGVDVRFSRSQNTFYIEPTTINELTKLAITQSTEEQELNQSLLPLPKKHVAEHNKR